MSASTSPWRPVTVTELADAAADPVARLEVALLAAWRPDTLLVHRDLPGWAMREHEGMTKRANSVLVLTDAPERGVPAHAVGSCVAWYAAHGLPALAVVPTDREPTVSTRPTGDAPVVVMTTTVEGLVRSGTAHEPPPVLTGPGPPSALVERTAARARRGVPSAQARAAALRLLGSAPQQLFARTAAGAVARIGLTGVDGVGVIDGVHVPPAARRRGEATAMVLALTAAAADMGVRTVALEVEADNDGALACYRRLGLTEHHSHRYVRLGT